MSLRIPLSSRRRSLLLGAVLLGPALATPLPAAAEKATPFIDPATGYRMSVYRAPVTLPPQGGARIDLAALDRLDKAGAKLVDVMPARAGYDPATGKWRLVDKRMNIPHSTWLPNVGQGMLEPRLAAYLAGSLDRLTGGRKDQPLVFYCMADCWMSWNAVKRAAGLGYTKVYWYADGTDGWFESGRDLETADVPGPVPPSPAPVEPRGNVPEKAR